MPFAVVCMDVQMRISIQTAANGIRYVNYKHLLKWCCIRVIISIYQHADMQTHKPYLGTRLKPTEEFVHCTQSELNSLTQFSVIFQNCHRTTADLKPGFQQLNLHTRLPLTQQLNDHTAPYNIMQATTATSITEFLMPCNYSLYFITDLYSYLLASLSLGTHTTHLQHAFIGKYIT